MKSKELIKALKEYISFLSEKYSNLSMFANIHGFKDSEEDIKKGQELRDEISKIDSTIKDKNIYKMELHETIDISDVRITRVPGGWLYLYINYSPYPVPPVFVPFNNEFKSPVFFHYCVKCKRSFTNEVEFEECPICQNKFIL